MQTSAGKPKVAIEIIKTPAGILLKDYRVGRGPRTTGFSPKLAYAVGACLSGVAKSEVNGCVQLDIEGEGLPEEEE